MVRRVGNVCDGVDEAHRPREVLELEGPDEGRPASGPAGGGFEHVVLRVVHAAIVGRCGGVGWGLKWIVGDVHGMSGTLATLLRVVRHRDAEAIFYFTGDYCDRGPDTRGVVDLLLPMVADGTAHCARGNHDDVFDLILHRESFASGPGLGGPADEATADEAARLFWNEGLPQTIASYGIEDGSAPSWLDGIRKLIPESHKHFFRTLPAFIDAGDFFVTHAAWPPDYPDDDAPLARDPHLRYEAIWGRYGSRQLNTPKLWRRRCYCGHTPTDNYLHSDAHSGRPGTVVVCDRLTLVDTAAFTPNGRLSAVCHETQDVVQIHHSGEVLT